MALILPVQPEPPAASVIIIAALAVGIFAHEPENGMNPGPLLLIENEATVVPLGHSIVIPPAVGSASYDQNSISSSCLTPGTAATVMTAAVLLDGAWVASLPIDIYSWS